jgi:VanZ family protein
MDKKIVFTVACVFYIIILFLGATVVKTADISKATNFDKVLHFLGFFVLTILLLITFSRYKLKNKYLKSFIIALGIGILIEIIQLNIPGREFSLLDILADALGIIIGSVLTWSFSRR